MRGTLKHFGLCNLICSLVGWQHLECVRRGVAGFIADRVFSTGGLYLDARVSLGSIQRTHVYQLVGVAA